MVIAGLVGTWVRATVRVSLGGSVDWRRYRSGRDGLSGSGHVLFNDQLHDVDGLVWVDVEPLAVEAIV